MLGQCLWATQWTCPSVPVWQFPSTNQRLGRAENEAGSDLEIHPMKPKVAHQQEGNQVWIVYAATPPIK